jgi:hypothetical protein
MVANIRFALDMEANGELLELHERTYEKINIYPHKKMFIFLHIDICGAG